MLATCRQAHQEAEEILLHENETNITFYFVQGKNRELRRTDNFAAIAVNGHGIRSETFRISTPSFSEWPAFLLRVSRRHVTVMLKQVADRSVDHTEFEIISKGLHHLYYFLHRSQAIRKLNISVVGSMHLTIPFRKNLLHPLPLFGPATEFNLSEQMAESELRDYVKTSASQKETRKTIDMYERFGRLRDEIDALLDFTTKVRMPGWPESLDLSRDMLLRFFTEWKTRGWDLLMCEWIETFETSLSNLDMELFQRWALSTGLDDTAKDLERIFTLSAAKAAPLSARTPGSGGFKKSVMGILKGSLPNFRMLLGSSG